MKRSVLIPGLILMLALNGIAVSSTAAEIYRYKDNNGHHVFVDNLSLVPAQYRPETDPQQPKDEPPTIHTEKTPPDWETRWNELITHTNSPEKSHNRFTPVKIIANQVIVPVIVQSKRKKTRMNLLLDTGASLTMLSKKSIKKLNIGHTRSSHARLANGSKLNIEIARLKSLQVGPIELTDIPVAIVKNYDRRRPFDGLLGMDVLRHRHYKIDYTNQQLIWE